ncbi:MAG: HlyD family efflux transporter periplasmic adaptor subunit [Gammaproteobacteria bacterium]|nr:HlyD family efflux transporter periplasmic adaptor subunit [Gammaproteobacteria bacterium]
MIKDTLGQDVVVEKSLKNTLKTPILVAGASLLILALYLWVNADTAERSVNSDRILTASVESGTFERDVASSGRIIASDAPTLYTSDEGQVFFEKQPGESVSEGDVIARVISPVLESQVAEARVSLEILEGELERMRLNTRRYSLTADKAVDLARVDLVAAEREYRRAQQLLDRELISRIDFEERSDNLDKTRLQYAHAQRESEITRDTAAFELSSAESEVDRQRILVTELERRKEALNITSPVDGAIGAWIASNQARVPAGAPLLSVVDLSAYEVELGVPDVYGDDLMIGMPVELTVAGEIIAAEISSISPEIRGNQLVARARFVGERPSSLRQNQRVSARVYLERIDNALILRRGAFLDSDGGTVAYVLEGDEAVRRNIEIGSRGTRYVEVISGLELGDEVIISSYIDMQNAERITLN